MDSIKCYRFCSAIFHFTVTAVEYFPKALPLQLMTVASFQEFSMFTLNFTLALGITLHCVIDKGLSAGDGGTMWSCCLWWCSCRGVNLM